MAKCEKLIDRFLGDYHPNLTWADAVKVLTTFGYVERKKGNGSSHKTFIKKLEVKDEKDTKVKYRKFMICRPHPDPTLKHYQFDDLKKLIQEELAMDNQGVSHG